MFKYLVKKQTPEQTIIQLEQKILELTAALQAYANQENWGETSAWGTKRKNRWLGEGDGADVAKNVLCK